VAVTIELGRPEDSRLSELHARPLPVAAKPAWLERYARRVFFTDLLAATFAAALAKLLRFGSGKATLRIDGMATVPYVVVAVVAILTWLLVLGAARGYERRALGIGSEEYRRVLIAATYFFALVATAVFVFQLNLARGFVATLIPLTMIFTALGRLQNRRMLRKHRRTGAWSWKVLVAGSREDVRQVAQHFERAPMAGYHVVGACVRVGDPTNEFTVGPSERAIPVVGATDQLLESLASSGADVLAVTGPGELENHHIRSLAVALESQGVDLVVVPAVTDVAGPRIAIRPVNGLPLLHVEPPRLSGPARVFKECFDRVGAAVALMFLLPVFIGVALAIKFTSPGPVFFRQARVGRRGRTFQVMKFRSMVKDAEARRDELLADNEHDGVLFKIRDDPRVTRVGRWLRRFSIDELPQLINVVRGDMSLVGPRPPLPNEVEQYGDDVIRRLLVKPGMTGLWQVSGRADLRWEESVALDLYYVENWSPSFDLAILWKTVNTVLLGRGAY
jgi:exopolysaccharide biosynthesis polyprenyl glycosylphosphotransferase